MVKSWCCIELQVVGVRGNLFSLSSCLWCWLALLAGMLEAVCMGQNHGKDIAWKLKVQLGKVTQGSGFCSSRSDNCGS